VGRRVELGPLHVEVWGDREGWTLFSDANLIVAKGAETGPAAREARLSAAERYAEEILAAVKAARSKAVPRAKVKVRR
jgi:hypothetical protein